MQTYNIVSVEETTIYPETGGSITETRKYPVDQSGSVVLDYQSKNRVIREDEMIVFDSMNEYLDWMANNR